MSPEKLLRRLASGALSNMSFADTLRLAQGFGFSVARISGGHHILQHPAVPGLLNLQEVGGQAKPYQIRQRLKLVERYRLALEDKS